MRLFQLFKTQSDSIYYRGIFMRRDKRNLNISKKNAQEIIEFIEKNYPKDEGILKIYKINTISHKRTCINKIRICQTLELDECDN